MRVCFPPEHFMNSQIENQTIPAVNRAVAFQRLLAVPLSTALVVSAISALVLAGWSFEIDFLKRIIPGYVFMNQATALAFALSSAPLLLIQSQKSGRIRLAHTCAAVVSLVGLIKLVELFGFFDLGIDRMRTTIVMTLRMVTVIAETQSFEVVSASNGCQAFRILQRDADFCAAIFDMMMPHLQGMDLIRYIKNDEHLRHIPIGMITAEQDPKIWDDSVAAGASLFLPKPFSPPQVLTILRRLINKGKS